MTAEHELESRYRRLMVAYPRRHRREYEEEMVAVLLADAAPGQRRPRVRDRADLLANALAVRVRGWAGARRDDTWRRAAYAVQILGAMALLAVGIRRLASGIVVDAAMGAIDVVRPVGWALVLAAALIGLRRTAAGVAVLAAAVEVYHVAGWYQYSPSQVLRSAWFVTAVLLVVGTSAWLGGGARAGRPRGLWLSGAALTVAAAAGVCDRAQSWSGFSGLDYAVTVDDQFIVRFAVPLYLVASVFAGLAWWRLGGPVRRRLLAFAAPVAGVAAMVAYGFAGFMYSSQRFPTPVRLIPLQWTILGVTPVLAFAVAVVVLNRWERLGELVELGRRADVR
jgi:hypothetical protein